MGGKQPLNIKTAVERPIFKLGLPNFEYFFVTKKSLFLTIAEKRPITETAVFGGYGGLRQFILFLSVYYHNKKLHA